MVYFRPDLLDGLLSIDIGVAETSLFHHVPPTIPENKPQIASKPSMDGSDCSTGEFGAGWSRARAMSYVREMCHSIR